MEAKPGELVVIEELSGRVSRKELMDGVNRLNRIGYNHNRVMRQMGLDIVRLQKDVELLLKYLKLERVPPATSEETLRPINEPCTRA